MLSCPVLGVNTHHLQAPAANEAPKDDKPAEAAAEAPKAEETPAPAEPVKAEETEPTKET